MRTLNAKNSSPPSRHRVLVLTAAAAFASIIPSTSYAFSPPRSIILPSKYNPSPLEEPRALRQCQTRYYASKREEDDGIFNSLKKAARKVLPKSWTQSEEERKAYLVKKEREQELSSGINQILKDAPLPVRMLGSLVTPIFSQVASSFQEQQEQTMDLIEEARSFIVSDNDAISMLGEPIVVQPPFSQSSSSSSINGETTTQVQASFPVQGQYQQGIASMTATEAGIQRLVLQVGGRNINIKLDKGRNAFQSSGQFDKSQQFGKNRINKNDIIDVEFVEKDSK
eukprot:CAMPEP_0178916376 /NCGR_PEP_ID=MMETSP0786-20121207/12599_1 /TAXON_ID=186022 /ORGANISM="Thalassionema frauenfeldii, Strain CCMP 1798" /LENGTH=282 /DNA_ID=CAMNT_0020589693 /DNA_START=97 /DNA_END=945 /DNA_ORIENTATION=+